MPVERGVIKRVNLARGFGFIKTEGCREEVYFRVCDGQFIQPGAKIPYFAGSKSIVDGVTRSLVVPYPEKMVVFERVQTENGFRASPWGYWRVWSAALEVISKRLQYRLVSNFDGGMVILWEGALLSELDKKPGLKALALQRDVVIQTKGRNESELAWRTCYESDLIQEKKPVLVRV